MSDRAVAMPSNAAIVRHLMPRRWPMAMLACAVLAPVAIMAACTRVMPGPAVCSQRLPCAGGNTCVLGRCRVNGTMPVSLDAPRYSADAARLVYVTEAGAHALATMPRMLKLGEREHDVTLLLGFSLPIPEGRRIQRALIELRPDTSCPAAPKTVNVELARIVAPWQPATVRAQLLPRMDLPMLFAPQHLARQPLRLDITELAQRWYADAPRSLRDASTDAGASAQPKKPKTPTATGSSTTTWGAVPAKSAPGAGGDEKADGGPAAQRTLGEHGLALRIRGDGAQPSCFRSQARLDVYLWPEKDAGADADAGEAASADAGDDGSDKSPESIDLLEAADD